MMEMQEDLFIFDRRGRSGSVMPKKMPTTNDLQTEGGRRARKSEEEEEDLEICDESDGGGRKRGSHRR